MNKNWFKICNAVDAADEAEVLIYDEIGMLGISAKDFVDQLKETGMKKVHVRINSPGGSTSDGFSIYNYLRGFRGQVRVTVDGMAGSIASVIAMAGKTITMADSAMMVIHNPWGIIMGGSKEAREGADVLDKLRDSIVRAYARTGQTADDIKVWMDEEKWMDAAEAVELGFADEVDAGVEAQNFACFNLARFKNAPDVDTSASPNMKLDEALAKITTLEANLTALTTEKTVLATAKTEIEAKVTGKDTEITNLQAQITAKDGEISTVKTELKTEKDARVADKTAADAALAAEKNGLQAKVDEELAKLGQKRLATGGDPAADKTTMNRVEFGKLSAKAQSEFCKNGGKITD